MGAASATGVWAASDRFKLTPLPTPEVGPTDQLIDELYQKATNRKVLIQIGKAAKLMRELKFDGARRAAGLVKSDPEFGDHARWLVAEATLLQADQELRLKHYDKAQLEAQEVITVISSVPLEYPSSPVVKVVARSLGRANLIMGHAAGIAKQWAQCRKNYEQAFVRLGSSDADAYIRPEDVTLYIQSCGHHGSEVCTSWLQRMAIVYPRSTPEGKTLAAEIPDFVNDLPKPEGLSKTTAPYHSPDEDTVAFEEAMAKYIEHKQKDSIPLFRKLLDEYPRSATRFRAKYWLAQAMIHSQMEADAKKLLLELQKSSPLSYYGLLASLATGMDLDVPLTHDAPAGQDFDPLLLPVDLVRLRRAQALISVKADEAASLELNELRPHDSLSTKFLIYLAALQSEAGNHAAAFRTLNEIGARGSQATYGDLGLSLIFPTENFELVKKIATEFKLDPILVLSLIKQESAFDSHAISNTGALGLMQIMPATAADTVTDLARTDLISPETNLRTGMKYLSQLLKHYNGNIVFALAAYNSGPGSVNRWIKSSPPENGLTDFIEAITYRETREYVSSIIRNYFWYARLLAPERGRSLQLAHFWGSVAAPPAEAEEPMNALGTPTPASPSPGPNPSPSPVVSASPEPQYGPASTHL